MNILSIVIIALVAASAFTGAVIGVVKGFTKVNSWAVELILTGLIIIPVSYRAIAPLGGSLAAIITLGVTVALVYAMLGLFKLFRFGLNSRIELRKKLSYYRQYDEIEDNTEKTLCAMGSEDKKAFKKLAKRKFKQSGGVWGGIDRVFGMIALALKGAVIAGIISAVALAIIDFSRLAAAGGSLNGALGGIYVSGAWAFFKNYIFDFIVIGIFSLCIRNGFAGGLSSLAWGLIVLGMVAGSAVLSFHLAFTAPEFLSAAAKMEGSLANSLAGVGDVLEAVGLTYNKLAQIIIGLIIFVFMLIAVILIAVFVPKLIDKARDGVIFRSIDGVLGAIALTAVVVGLLLVVGALANSLRGQEFMDVFSAYFAKSGVATYFYDKNLLNSFGVLTEFPLIGTWFN